ncbi:hypothetical protein DWB84_06795 [Saccharophagus sp. K07]|nr:hypothetical protein [Saccharophagus sp. K07]
MAVSDRMTTIDLFKAVQGSDIAIAFGNAPLVFGIAAQLFHISGIVLILTPTLLVALRIAGTGLVDYSAAQLERKSRVYVATGLLFVVFSGLFMLIPSATLYQPNPAFQLKLILLPVALAFHYGFLARIAKEEFSQKWLAKIIALFMALLWFAVGMAGRAIGFLAA